MRFKEGDKVVSAKFDRFDEWKGLTVSVAHSDWATCKSTTGHVGAFAYDDLKLAKPRDYVADHARRSLRKLGLTKQEAAAFVRNVQERGRVSGHSTFSLSQLSRKAERIDLLHGFYWGESKEGYPYWSAIYDRLLQERK